MLDVSGENGGGPGIEPNDGECILGGPVGVDGGAFCEAIGILNRAAIRESRLVLRIAAGLAAEEIGAGGESLNDPGGLFILKKLEPGVLIPLVLFNKGAE